MPHPLHPYRFQTAHVEGADSNVALDDNVGGIKSQGSLEAVLRRLPPRQENVEVSPEGGREER
jgi:hypothetical protein